MRRLAILTSLGASLHEGRMARKKSRSTKGAQKTVVAAKGTGGFLSRAVTGALTGAVSGALIGAASGLTTRSKVAAGRKKSTIGRTASTQRTTSAARARKKKYGGNPYRAKAYA
jgi:hypothetical protein